MNQYFCYYNNDEYMRLALACKESFERFGLQIHVATLPDRHGWMKNCMSRAVALQEAATHTVPNGNGIGLLDADLTCFKTPHRLMHFEGDVAVHDKAADKPPTMTNCPNSRYSAGVICFAPTPLGRECLRRWAELCVADKAKGEVLREQLYLEQAIEDGRKQGLVVYNLGPHYNQPVAQDTVILHHVESRRSREKIGGGM